MRGNLIEAVLGAVVLVVAAIFLAFAYSIIDVRPTSGYDISAVFHKVGGLEKGAAVRIRGIPIGTVVDRTLNERTFEAHVTLSIASNIQLPTDSVASVEDDGLFSGTSVGISPGKAAEHIAPGGRIANTRDYLSLEDKIGNIIFK